jgi:hypothetical protein
MDLKWNKKEPQDLSTISLDMFMMLMPFYYFFRMPLILGILVNYSLNKNRFDDNFQKTWVGNILSKHHYTLQNITEYQHKDDRMIL